ncbi:MAG: hypothetical protein AB8H86_07895 [Polyangiales bacterium]
MALFSRDRLSRDPAQRLRFFVDAGLIPHIPTSWQLLCGQIEMAPYVILPDEGDDARYAGAPLGHPLTRTPIVFMEIGLDHLRAGHGLHARPESVYRHLNFVFHEGMPVFDLQLVQTVPGGLQRFREYTQAIEDGTSRKARRQRSRVDMILPGSSEYRAQFLRPGGWIERAEKLDYPTDDDIADFLRPEFSSLVRFANYCRETFDETPAYGPALPGRMLELATRALRSS